ncbi:MAG: M56 family metallopeptidase [Pseudomonadota bacterium]
MTVENAFNAYIDINILLIAVATIWAGLRWGMAHSPLRSAYLTQLHLLYGLVAMVILSPLVVFCIETCQRLGLLSLRGSLSVSDFAVAQYLHGNIALSPTKFESLLMLRSEWTHDVATFGSWMGYAVFGLLFGGFTWIVARNARNSWRLIRLIARAYPLRRVGKIDIRVSHETRVPFSTRGVRRHYVVLPAGLLGHSNDARIAVAHELQHIRQRDLTWEVALELMRPFFFWNPAFAYCKRDVERLRELACDQQVVSRKTHGTRAYCECLLRACQTSLTGSATQRIMTPSVPFVQLDLRRRANHSEGFLKQRIVSMIEQGQASGRHRLGPVMLMSLCITVACVTLAIRPVENWSHDRLMLSTIVNLERLNNRTLSQ